MRENLRSDSAGRLKSLPPSTRVFNGRIPQTSAANEAKTENRIFSICSSESVHVSLCV